MGRSLSQACDIAKYDLVAHSEEKLAIFTNTLNSLLKEVEENQGIRKINEEQIHLLAMECYEQWQQLRHQERSDSVNNRVPIGKHQLPPLSYRYDELEPAIDRKTMELHHLKHHQSYVDGLNRAEKEIQKRGRVVTMTC